MTPDAAEGPTQQIGWGALPLGSEHLLYSSLASLLGLCHISAPVYPWPQPFKPGSFAQAP